MLQYLIQGLFYQGRLAMGLYRGESVAATELFNCMFAGFLWHKNGEPGFEGFMTDTFGESTISEIDIADEKVVFTKKYKGRTDPIKYLFTKREGVSWVGTYSGNLTGTGISRCVLTEVPDSFFDPQKTMEILGRQNAFEPPPRNGLDR